MINRVIFSIAIVLAATACKQKKKPEPASVPEIPQLSSLNPEDTLRRALMYSLDKDSFFFTQGIRTYFKSGYLFDSSQKNALVIYASAEDTFRCNVELYRLENNEWTLCGKVSDLIRNIPLVEFADFNFDGYKDILVGQKKSQTSELTNKYLLTVDPKTNKLTHHESFAALVSPVAEPHNRIIRSVRIEYGPPVLFCEVFSEWKNGKLETKSVNCPSASVN